LRKFTTRGNPIESLPEKLARFASQEASRPPKNCQRSIDAAPRYVFVERFMSG
jgi:hypothetical protein